MGAEFAIQNPQDASVVEWGDKIERHINIGAKHGDILSLIHLSIKYQNAEVAERNLPLSLADFIVANEMSLEAKGKPIPKFDEIYKAETRSLTTAEIDASAVLRKKLINDIRDIRRVK